MEQAKKNQCYTLQIEGYSSEGDGIARLNGMTVFVKGAIHGETCRVKLLKVGRTAAWGKVEEILTSSPARISPDCPHFPQCGGCALRHMSYDEELHFKRQRVDDALHRIGGLNISVSNIHGAACPERYRNKAQFPVSDKTGLSIGFFRSRSHDVLDVPDCLLQQKSANDAARAIKEWMTFYHVPAYNEREHTGFVRHVYVRTNRSGEVLVCLLCNGTKFPHKQALIDMLRQAVPQTTGIVFGINTEKTNVILGKQFETLWGKDFLYDTLCGLEFKLSVPSFFQVNPVQTETLYQKAAEFAHLTGTETVVDLYCGTGTISLILAQQAGHVIGAEIVSSAIDDAKENAHRNGLTNAEFICADAAQAAAELARRGLQPDVISVDPPRKGMSEEVISHIVSMQPKRIVYVSCDPATLARDLNRFSLQGYVAERVEAVDMFPRTKHVETVCLLVRRNGLHVDIDVDVEEMLQEKRGQATYAQIKDYVLEQNGLKVSSLYISQIKRKCGLDVSDSYNKPKSEDTAAPQCPPEKEEAIMNALRHFGVI